MEHMWSWGGKFFGYRSNNMLFTFKGNCVGVFDGNIIFGKNGKYLGEIANENRLITDKSKKYMIGNRAPNVRGGISGRYANYAGYVMYAGYEDFPDVESF